MENCIRIGERHIGRGESTFIIAELSANHLGKFENAVKLIEEAKKAGADAVKLQTYTPDTITIKSEEPYFYLTHGTIWDGMNIYDLYSEAYTPWEWQPKLKEIADREGILCFSSPFDRTAVDFLEGMDVPAYKIASFEITDIPLIEYIASKGKPVIISTGIADLADIDCAVKACQRRGNNNIALLKCTSTYPAPLEDCNIRTIPNLAETFNVVSGISDHTLGISVPVAAVALGARIIEKHLTLNRGDGGPDAAFSLEPDEFKRLVDSVRDVEKALGTVTYELTAKMKDSKKHARSLFTVKDIDEGELLTEDNIRSIRPGYGLHPKYVNEVVGTKAMKPIKKGTPLSWNLIKK